MRVRDRRQFGYFTVDNRILDHYAGMLGPFGIAIYCAILRHANNETGDAWPTYSRMVRKLRVSPKTVQRVVKLLEQLGLVEVIRCPGRGNIYQVRNVPTFDEVECDQEEVDESPQDEADNPCSPVVQCGLQGTGTTSLETTDQKNSAVTQTGPHFPGDHTPPRAPRGIEQDSPTTPTREPLKAVAAGDELGQKNREAAELLFDRGVTLKKADDLANTRDVNLIRLICAHWDREAAGPRPVGPGLLVAMCQTPGAYGFTERDGMWHAPKQSPQKGPKNPPPQQPTMTLEERIAKTRAERAAAERERQKADAETKGLRFNQGKDTPK